MKMGKTVAVGHRKALLVLGIAVNLLLLGYFKYANFFVDNINLIFGNDLLFHRIILPLAISFFTIQQVSYLIDTYRSEISEHDFLKYSFFVTFFPKLLAGPIVRYNQMFPQQAQGPNTSLNLEAIVIGLSVFFIGLFKKVILADSMAPHVDLIFGSATANFGPTFFTAWTGALAYTLQLYFDFSGYCDMAIGLGLMFGFRLPLNFYSPYKAVDAIDFWRRWHITLSQFFRDYLYIPLGGNRKGPARRNANLVLTMLVVGLWHGAGWTFIIWGALHGLYLVISHKWRELQKSLHWNRSGSSRRVIVVSTIITFIAVTIAWVFFRADNLQSATEMLRGMFGLNGIVLPVSLSSTLSPLSQFLHAIGMTFGPVQLISKWSYVWISLLLFLCWFAPNSQEFMANYQPTINTFSGKPAEPSNKWLRWNPNFLGAITIAFMTVLGIVGLTQVSTFIYFRF
jgi:D-alanyl-lipoteichoic acid acyltransferase DltB (MBOAT superfamily)